MENNLVIDIGNTATKIGLFHENELVEHHIFESTKSIESILQEYKLPSIISSVVPIAISIQKSLEKNYGCLFLNNNTDIPIKMEYITPETLGNDRLACAVAIAHYYKNKNALAIDIGTCIKFDFVNNNGVYLGGSISPGLHMRYKSLNTFTGKLPLITPKSGQQLIGNSTKTAIISGVQNGIIQEVMGVTSEYKKKYSDIKIVFTGGDAPFFEKDLKNDTFADPFLVLKGLNIILNHNA